MEQFELHKECEINKLLLEKEEDYEDETDEKYHENKSLFYPDFRTYLGRKRY